MLQLHVPAELQRPYINMFAIRAQLNSKGSYTLHVDMELFIHEQSCLSCCTSLPELTGQSQGSLRAITGQSQCIRWVVTGAITGQSQGQSQGQPQSTSPHNASFGRRGRVLIHKGSVLSS